MAKSTRTPGSLNLQWAKVPRSHQREYTLTQGKAIIARLAWQKAWGSHAVGESPSGAWSFKRVGFFQTRVSIRPVGSETELGSFFPALFGGGRIELVDGRSWRLQPRGMFNSEYILTDVTGRVTISLKLHGWGKGADVQTGPSRPDDLTMNMLILLVWHVVLLAIDDMASAGAVVATMG